MEEGLVKTVVSIGKAITVATYRFTQHLTNPVAQLVRARNPQIPCFYRPNKTVLNMGINSRPSKHKRLMSIVVKTWG